MEAGAQALTRARSQRRGIAARLGGAGLVAVVALALHAAWIGVYFAVGHEARDFIKLGTRYVELSDASSLIRFDPTYDYPRNRDAPTGTGYDGQFSYFLAVDPSKARYYMKDPGYRYGRILYPMTARALAAGRAGAIPYTLLLVNWLAIGVGTLALAAWLKRRSFSPWFALGFGLYPGLLLALQRDLTEPLAYSLAAVGVYLLDYGGRRRVLWGGIAFGLAALARETTVVFSLVFAVALLLGDETAAPLRGRIRAGAWRALAFAGLALGPLVAYSMFLRSWLGPAGLHTHLAAAPFLGLIDSSPWQITRQPPVIVSIVIPALIVGGLALRGVRSGPGRREFAVLLVNVLFFVVLLGSDVYSGGYTGVGRNATGVLLAAVLCVPYLRPQVERRRWLAWASAALAFSILPAMLVYGFL